MKRLLVLSLLAGCAHGGVTISTAQRTELAALAHDADRLCQAHGNLSDENFPDMPKQDAACVKLAHAVAAVVK